MYSDREVADESLLIRNRAVYLVAETQINVERSSIVAVVLLAAVDDERLGILGLDLVFPAGRALFVLFAGRITRVVLIEDLVYEINLVLALLVSNRRDLVENLLHSLIDEPLIRLSLVVDKVGHLDYFVDLGIRLPLCLALFYGMDHD